MCDSPKEKVPPFDIEKFFQIRDGLREILELESAIREQKEREKKLWFRCYKKLTKFLLLFFNKPDSKVGFSNSSTADKDGSHNGEI